MGRRVYKDASIAQHWEESMRIAAFNVENLFDRAKAFNASPDTSSEVQSKLAELNSLFERPHYSDANKSRMLELMDDLGIRRSDTGPYVLLRKLRGQLIKRPRGKPAEIVADGAEDWVGWGELKTESVNAVAIQNTGRVIRDIDADILAVVEAENRVVLKLFVDQVLDEVGGETFEQVMVIDGNDMRGIDVGLMTRRGVSIDLMRSHIHDKDADGRAIFSRDCPEYAVRTPNGDTIWVLPNHFKSKYGGNDLPSRAKRLAQATRTAQIYGDLRAAGYDKVVVLGDLNDTPDSEELAPLLSDTDLCDVGEHPTFDTGEFAGAGTHALGNDSSKIDYLLLSPALFDLVTASGLFRKGAWPGSSPKRWEVYPEIKRKVHVASDHHVIWADLDIT